MVLFTLSLIIVGILCDPLSGYGFIDFMSEDDAKAALTYIQTKNPGFNAKYAKVHNLIGMNDAWLYCKSLQTYDMISKDIKMKIIGFF